MQDPFNEISVQVSIFLAGFSGGIVRALSRGHFILRELIVSPICGALSAGYLTLPFIHYLDKIGFPLPPQDSSQSGMLAAGFLVGICGMWVADAIMLKIGNVLKITKENK